MSMFPDARILNVDLTNRTISVSVLPGEIYRLYPGGSALASYLMLQEGLDPMIDPLSPDAPLAVSVSPLTGLAVAGNSRFSVTAKSPLTGALGQSQGGGYFGATLRANEWDCIMLRGQASTPVYIYIDKEEVSIRDASLIWGKTTLETERLIKEDLQNSKVDMCEIGPAGENLVRFGCIMSNASRAAGRNGFGAVMGSKRVKAIVAKKQPPRKPFDPEGFKNYFKDAKQRIESNESVLSLGEDGTAGGVVNYHHRGFLSTRNWQENTFSDEGALAIDGSTMTKTVLTGRGTCYACGIRCKREVTIPEKGVIPEYGGPEFETAILMGSVCGIGDLGDVCLANQLCNAYGMDTISAGGTVAFAMECYEKEKLPAELKNDLELRFGNGSAQAALLTQIAYRSTPLGDLLAEGSYRASLKLGNGTEEMFIGVKGQEYPAHMPQLKRSLSVHYATNSYGADHQTSEHDPILTAPPDNMMRKRLAMLGIWKGYPDPYALDDEKMRYMQITEQFYYATDSLGLCQFAWGASYQLYGPEDFVPLTKYGLGVEMSLAELLQIGERSLNMCRYFNYMSGFRPDKDDTIPRRILKPMPNGPTKGMQISFDDWNNARKMYYTLLGSDPITGRPSNTILARLSLQWMTDIYKK